MFTSPYDDDNDNKKVIPEPDNKKLTPEQLFWNDEDDEEFIERMEKNHK